MMSPSAPLSPQTSPWHTPVPYLFGGLAAMMGLIAFALLVLACSYWKLSGYFDENNIDRESGNVNNNDNETSPSQNYHNQDLCDKQEMYFVIMAGEAKPTFLATPCSSRTTSFGSSSWRSNITTLTESSLLSEDMIDGRSDLVQGRNMENYESTDHFP